MSEVRLRVKSRCVRVKVRVRVRVQAMRARERTSTLTHLIDGAACMESLGIGLIDAQSVFILLKDRVRVRVRVEVLTVTAEVQHALLRLLCEFLGLVLVFLMSSHGASDGLERLPRH